MSASAKLFEVLRSVLLQLPSLLTILGCIVAAIIRWKGHPQVSLTAVIALVLLAVHVFAFAFVYAFVPDFFALRWGYGTMHTVITAISFAYNSLLAIVMAVLLTAVFMKRSTSVSQI